MWVEEQLKWLGSDVQQCRAAPSTARQTQAQAINKGFTALLAVLSFLITILIYVPLPSSSTSTAMVKMMLILYRSQCGMEYV